LLDEISRILAWHLAARNKQRFARAVLTQPNPNPSIMTAAGVVVESSTTTSARSPVEILVAPGPGHERCRGLSPSREASMRLVVAGIGVADRGYVLVIIDGARLRGE
jgi:hypothetical protein